MINAKELAAKISKKHPFILKSIKASIYRDEQKNLVTCLENEGSVQERCLFTNEFRNSIETFLQKN